MGIVRFSASVNIISQMSTACADVHTWLESRLPAFHGDPNYKQTSVEMPQVSQWSKGGKGKCQILKVSQRIIISSTFLAPFIWKRTRNRAVIKERQEKKQLARLQRCSLLWFAFTHCLYLLLRGEEKLLIFLIHVESCTEAERKEIKSLYTRFSQKWYFTGTPICPQGSISLLSSLICLLETFS